MSLLLASLCSQVLSINLLLLLLLLAFDFTPQQQEHLQYCWCIAWMDSCNFIHHAAKYSVLSVSSSYKFLFILSNIEKVGKNRRNVINVIVVLRYDELRKILRSFENRCPYVRTVGFLIMCRLSTSIGDGGVAQW